MGGGGGYTKTYLQSFLVVVLSGEKLMQIFGAFWGLFRPEPLCIFSLGFMEVEFIHKKSILRLYSD